MKSLAVRASLSFAMACLASAVLVAQEPPPSTPPANPQTPAATRGDDRDRMVTATGCLKQEKDVPGARPNVAERAGVGEDFILTQAKLTRGSTGASGSSPTPSTGASARGGGVMYKISGLDDEKLRAHANQQVEVQGRLLDRTVTGAQKPTTPGADTRPDEVQEIRATSIKMMASTCSAGTN